MNSQNIYGQKIVVEMKNKEVEYIDSKKEKLSDDEEVVYEK